MSSFQKMGLLVIAAHCVVVVWHLLVAEAITADFPVARLALPITVLTLAHLVVFVCWWMRSAGFGGLLAFLLFAIPLGFGSYEHLLSSGPNNVLRVSGTNSGAFQISVFLLLFLEVCGVWLALRAMLPSSNRPAIGHS